MKTISNTKTISEYGATYRMMRVVAATETIGVEVYVTERELLFYRAQVAQRVTIARKSLRRMIEVATNEVLSTKPKGVMQ